MSQPPLIKPEIPSGTLIDNRYIIQQLLGQGGLGRTYLAFDTRRFNEACVLKEFAPIGTGGGGLEKCRNLFKREAKILHQLEHPQIPRFLACFEGDGRLFLVQEYVNGKTYSALLRDRQLQGQTFTEQEVIQWLKYLLPVLEYIHQHHIIHRDISPDNIMLPEGNILPVLIDFGVGKQIADLNDVTSSNQATFVGKMSLVGKVGYAPREQISLGLCSPSSDLYALGVTAVVLLTGKDPSFLMDQYSLEWKWRFHTYVSDGFAQILDKMLSDTPRHRYQTSQEVLRDLELLGRPQTASSTMFDVPPTILTPDSQTTVTIAQSPNSDLDETVLSKPLGQQAFPHPQTSRHPQIHQNQQTQQTNQNPQTSRHPQTYQGRSSYQNQPTNQNQQQITSLNAAFVQRCQDALAFYIGPMASLIVEDTLADNPQVTPYQFVELLAREIPESEAALEFTRRLFS
ncbi:serine/threonine-protein kinase [Fischerella thermalis]|jgi:serine/threonine protein kinase|uniref:non-specific serine/threonine protein kinase n=1 Tax=Fischerella thermalis JSC-11 TaxID=741277 RepID=G6FXP1_9CYAN|nr:serine/threonine-protein kinase [Fischerella thermalis]PMB05301.1 serine/threonine protein kinase [Fischerella thermalis CCMEE 5273]RDH51878.1 serine/threonine protein kinase [Mastigocladus laminosus WC112]EHC10103.1 serine/threonine protein kinase [Fischerella thermalis JSC-11]PLZ07272.1 serine/threonine protein kinase [Fischerella thermalis WC1110]PLZ09600.1 serine/threonine protein kinase [Fischerella thermalis WC119]